MGVEVLLAWESPLPQLPLPLHIVHFICLARSQEKSPSLRTHHFLLFACSVFSKQIYESSLPTSLWLLVLAKQFSLLLRTNHICLMFLVHFLFCETDLCPTNNAQQQVIWWCQSWGQMQFLCLKNWTMHLDQIINLLVIQVDQLRSNLCTSNFWGSKNSH